MTGEIMSANKLDIQEIFEYLPHRYPFLLVDRVLDFVPGESLVAIKNVTVNEPCFTGHFPDRPIMPGVLIVEAMAQATGILGFKTLNSKPTENSIYYLAGVDKARFKQPVVPGDQMTITVTLSKQKRNILWFEAKTEVEGKVVASAQLMCAVQENVE